MSSTPEESARIAALVNRAWGALAQGDHAEACELLAPYADETRESAALAQVWAAMLSALDDERHLSYELSRLAGRWAEEPDVVAELAQSALKFCGRQLSLKAPPSIDPLPAPEGAYAPSRELEPALWLGARVVSYCLEHAAPSAPEERAALYLLRARLLSLGGAEAEEGALGDFEVALSLSPELGLGWYELARLHLRRGRWEKALGALAQARAVGLDALQLTWLEVVAKTGLGGETASDSPALWVTLNHDELEIGAGGRAVKRGYEPQLVALHSHITDPHGGYDLTQAWALERVWVQPLSPCHGRVLHPTLSPLPAGYDDLVIWEPQPAQFEDVEGDERPVFRAIACLERGRAQSRPLPRSSLSAEQLSALNEGLPAGVFYYQAPHAPAERSGVICWPRGEPLTSALEPFEARWAALELP